MNIFQFVVPFQVNVFNIISTAEYYAQFPASIQKHINSNMDSSLSEAQTVLLNRSVSCFNIQSKLLAAGWRGSTRQENVANKVVKDCSIWVKWPVKVGNIVGLIQDSVVLMPCRTLSPRVQQGTVTVSFRFTYVPTSLASSRLCMQFGRNCKLKL